VAGTAVKQKPGSGLTFGHGLNFSDAFSERLCNSRAEIDRKGAPSLYSSRLESSRYCRGRVRMSDLTPAVELSAHQNV
jgi:hypothetical protein